MSSSSPQRPQTMGQVLQSFASALEDERKRGLPRFNREQVARIQNVVKHLADPQAHTTDDVTPSRNTNREHPRIASDHSDAAHVDTRAAQAVTAASTPQPAHVKKSSVSNAQPQRSSAAHPSSRPTPDTKSARTPAIDTPTKERMPWMIDEDVVVAAQPSTPIPTPTISAKTSVRSDSSALESLRQELVDCQRCGLCTTRTHVIFGEGNPNARLMLIGEAPSRADDQSGHIFSDEAGELLTNMLQAMTLSRQDVYCTNILKCHPPSHRAAEREELATCAPFLRRQIEAIQPDVILTLGSQASRLLLGARFPFAQNRGEWNTWETIDVMPTWHPSYLLQHPREKASAWQDLQKVMLKLGLS